MTQSGHRRLQFAVAQPCGLEATLNKGIAIRAMAKAAQVYVEIACSPKIAVAEAFRVVQHRNDFRARCEVRQLSRPSAEARCDDISKLRPKRFPNIRHCRQPSARIHSTKPTCDLRESTRAIVTSARPGRNGRKDAPIRCASQVSGLQPAERLRDLAPANPLTL